MGAKEDDDSEEGKTPDDGVRGVRGAEGGSDGPLSSVELSDSLRKWLYLVLGTSSMVS